MVTERNSPVFVQREQQAGRVNKTTQTSVSMTPVRTADALTAWVITTAPANLSGEERIAMLKINLVLAALTSPMDVTSS
jgi:hypothetical protein